MTGVESAERVEQAATRVGSALDARWVVESLIGVGGMAAVYAASAGEERVAIKVLHPDLTRSQRAVERFRREGAALRAARHPAVPRVRGEGTAADGCPYLAMELLLGETVDARRRRFGGRLAWAEVVQIALVVLDVLDVVHRRGLLHRDVKPSNVLWLDDGSIRLIDFGIAKMARGDEEFSLTRTGAVPGSLAFMSPEHALGVPSELDARSDLWSLGATMFLLLSGRPVHESQTEVEALARSASQRARSLGSVASGVPPALIAVVDRALAFERRKRFADAAEMREAIRELSSASVRPALGRRRWRFALAPAVLMGLCGLGVWAFMSAFVGEAKHAARAVVAAASGASPSPEIARPSAPARTERELDAEPALALATALSLDTKPSRPPRPPQHMARGATGPAPNSSASSAQSMATRCDPPFLIDPTTGTRRVKPGC